MLGRTLGLEALVRARLRAELGVRFARVLAWVASIAFGSAILVLWPTTHGSLADVVAVRALKWISWVGSGLASWSLARDLAAAAVRDGTAALAAQRGFSGRALVRAQWVATMTTIAHVTMGPALLLTGLVLGTARSVPELGARTLFVLGAIGYVFSLAAVLGALSRAAAFLWPRHGRVLLTILVFAPYLLRPALPELVGLTGWAGLWLDGLRRLGAGFA